MKRTSSEKASIIISVIFIIAAVATVFITEIGSRNSRVCVNTARSEYAISNNHVASSSELLNINKASAEELCSLPGIGDSIASKIIEYREKNGAFRDISDIIDVSGIGFATFEKIKGKISV